MSIISCWPPAPEPKITPTSVRFSSVSSKPESASACFAGGDAEVQARLAAASGLGVHPVRRVEVLDLAGELRLVGRRVEIGDGPEPGHAVDEVGPGGGLVVADGADDTETGDDDAAVVVGIDA